MREAVDYRCGVPIFLVEGVAEGAIEVIDDVPFEVADHVEQASSDVGKGQLADYHLSAQVGVFEGVVAEPASLEQDAACREVVKSDIGQPSDSGSAGDGARHAEGVVHGVWRGVGPRLPHDEGILDSWRLSGEVGEVELHSAVVALADGEVSEDGVAGLFGQ